MTGWDGASWLAVDSCLLNANWIRQLGMQCDQMWLFSLANLPFLVIFVWVLFVVDWLVIVIVVMYLWCLLRFRGITYESSIKTMTRSILVAIEEYKQTTGVESKCLDLIILLVRICNLNTRFISNHDRELLFSQSFGIE